jgi:hypothetical protein
MAALEVRLEVDIDCEATLAAADTNATRADSQCRDTAKQVAKNQTTLEAIQSIFGQLDEQSLVHLQAIITGGLSPGTSQSTLGTSVCFSAGYSMDGVPNSRV